MLTYSLEMLQPAVVRGRSIAANIRLSRALSNTEN